MSAITPAALREEMAGNIAVLRTIPVDDTERARLLAEHAKAITGCQCGEDDCWQCRVWCWKCRTDQDRSQVQPDSLTTWACRDDVECKRRAAEFEYADDEEFAYQAAQGRGDCGVI